MTGSRRRAWWLTAIGLLIVAVYLLPVYWMIATSLKEAGDVFATPPHLVPSPPTMSAYADAVWGNKTIARGLGNSAVIATGTTVLTLLVAVPAAFALARYRLRLLTPLLLLFLAVQMIPSVNLALPLFVIFSRVGLVNTYTGLVLATSTITIPLAVTLLRPYFLSVPGEVIDAARVDGCSRFTAFLRVAVPVSRPGIVTAATISFLMAWGEFVFALSLATDEARQPITVVLAGLTATFGTRWAELMAVSAVVALPIIVTFVFLQRFVVGGLTAGATKG